MVLRHLTAVILALGASAQAAGLETMGPAPARMAEADRVRLAEAFAVMAGVQDEAWPRWSVAPSSLVLVDRDHEYLLRSLDRPEGFVVSESDPRLGGPVRVRARTFSPSLLATFPAFGPTPTIVVGTARTTGKHSTAWVLAVLHEHFHQLQYSDPGYWTESQALGLSGSDQSGMWMLDYPFPYEATSGAFAELSREMARLLDGAAPARPEEREAFWGRYGELCGTLKPEDRRYLSFQVWQEGIARYAELSVAERAGRTHRVSADFAALRDYRTFAAAAAALRRETMDELRTQTMAKDRRTVFYAFGAGLGLLLDQEGVAWRDRYLTEKFRLEAYRALRRDPDAVPVPGATFRMGTDDGAVPALRARHGVGSRGSPPSWRRDPNGAPETRARTTRKAGTTTPSRSGVTLRTRSGSTTWPATSGSSSSTSGRSATPMRRHGTPSAAGPSPTTGSPGVRRLSE